MEQQQMFDYVEAEIDIFKFMKTFFKQNKTFAEIKEIPRSKLETLYAYGYNHIQSGQYESAAKVFQTLIFFDHLDSKHYLAFGACLQKQQKFDLALIVYTAALYVDAENPKIKFNLGICCLENGQLDAAESYFLDAYSMLNVKKKKKDADKEFMVGANKLWKLSRRKQGKKLINIENAYIHVDGATS